MPDIRKAQNNFTSGVLSESVYGRVDIEKYAAGCKQIINCVVKVHGGVSNRPGTNHVDEVSEPGRLIDFTYNVEQAYALLFMDFKMRIYKDGGIVVYPVGHPNAGDTVVIVTPYAYADLAELTYAQSADVVFFANSSYPAYKLTRTDHHLWTFALVEFDPVQVAPAAAPGLVETGFTAVTDRTIEYKISAVSESSEESYPSELGTTDIDAIWPDGAFITITWAEATNAVRYNVYKNSRGYWGWIGTVDALFTNLLTVDTQVTLADTMTIGDKLFTFVADGTEVLDGDISIGTNLPTGQANIVAAINGSDGINTASEFVTASAFATNISTFSPLDATISIPITIASSFTTGTNIFTIAEVSFVDDFIEEDSKDGPKEARNPFSSADNYPGAVGIYQQRMLYGKTNNNPQTVWTSQTGLLNNFSVSQPLKATDAIEGVANTLQMNEIRHFFPLEDVLVLTNGAEIVMSAGRNSDAITPIGDLNFRPQSYWGISFVPPLIAGDNILIVQNSGNVVRDLFYILAEGKYVGTELSVLSPDLLLSPIVDWTYQNEPYHTVYACREDGKMLMLAYMREQNVYAWSLAETTEGNYISTTSVRNDTKDDVYFLVKRDAVYHVEYQNITTQGSAREDSFFVDDGLTYDGVATDTVTALWLANRDVAVLADGSAVTATASALGVVTLDRTYSKIHVGLPYTSLVETLDPEISDDKGFTGGKTKSVSRLYFNVVDTVNIDAGYIENGTENFSITKFPQAVIGGDAPPLVTGYFPATIPSNYRTQAGIAFRQTLPLPMNVLSVTSEISVGSK